MTVSPVVFIINDIIEAIDIYYYLNDIIIINTDHDTLIVEAIAGNIYAYCELHIFSVLKGDSYSLHADQKKIAAHIKTI